MNTSLVSALIGLAGLVVGSSTTLAALSPATRRLKRLEQLIALRPSVEDPETQRRVDYATERLSHQIAEDVVANGDRASTRLVFMCWLTMFSGLIWVTSVIFQIGDSSVVWYHLIQAAIALFFVVFGYFVLLWKSQSYPKKLASAVEIALAQRRNHQRSQPARAVGGPEGDVPAP